MSVVRVDHVSKDYRLGRQTFRALHDVSLAVAKGRFLAIAGPSGSGKSTLLNLIGCIDTPTEGQVYIGKEEVGRKTPDELADLRASALGFIFQTFNLLPVLSAAENVEYPLLQRRDVSESERKKRVDYFLDIVGLSKFADHRPNQLSGGQRQRVAIARALVVEPDFVFFDEPFTALDVALKRRMQDLVIDAARQTRFGALFITHDLMEAIRISHRILVLDLRGRGIAGERTLPAEPGDRDDDAVFALRQRFLGHDGLFAHLDDVDERLRP